MSDFRQLSQSVLASPQITTADLAAAADRGVTLVINNRPDGEAPDEPQGTEIEAAARALGMDYVAIPITHAGFSAPQVAAMRQALDNAAGPVLTYCRSGTRSTLLWSLAQAQAGIDLDEIAGAAQSAGYDVSPVRQVMDVLAAQARGQTAG